MDNEQWLKGKAREATTWFIYKLLWKIEELKIFLEIPEFGDEYYVFC